MDDILAIDTLVLGAMRLAERAHRISGIYFGLPRNIMLLTTPATPFLGSAPSGLLFVVPENEVF